MLSRLGMCRADGQGCCLNSNCWFPHRQRCRGWEQTFPCVTQLKLTHKVSLLLQRNSAARGFFRAQPETGSGGLTAVGMHQQELWLLFLPFPNSTHAQIFKEESNSITYPNATSCSFLLPVAPCLLSCCLLPNPHVGWNQALPLLQLVELAK